MKCSLCDKVALYTNFKKVGFCGNHREEAVKAAEVDRNHIRVSRIKNQTNTGINMAGRGGTRRGSGHSKESHSSYE